MTKKLLLDLKKNVVIEIGKSLLVYLGGLVVSLYWLYFILVLNNILIIIAIWIAIFAIAFYLFRRKFTNVNEMIKYGVYLITPILAVFLSYSFFIEHKNIQEMNLRFIHNKAVTEKTSIIKSSNWYSLNKNPVEKHPYIGLVSFWELTNNNKMYISLKGKLNWPSWIGIVLTNKETFPTEYLEYRASSASEDKLSLHLIDWKDVRPLLKGKGDIYEGKDFTLAIEIDKASWKICVFDGVISKNCKDLPNTTTFNYLGFKLTDNDTSGNNPYVPEIKKFDIYSMKF